MGVFGLWDILLTTAQKINIQKLSGKVLAIDASIWLVKAQSIFLQDSQKIKCILQKIIYLRRNNILPIFIFDGISPAIKRKTLQKRRQKLRQGSQIDIRKKTQIQVMHLLQNDNNKKYEHKQSTKQQKIIQKQQKMKQIDKLLNKLNQVQVQRSQQITQQDFNKIKLQSQVLTYKYQLMLQDPRLQGLEKINLQQFSILGIQQKLQYLNLLQFQKWNYQSRKNKKQQINQLSKLTHQQQILYQMKKIEKKTKLRQLQNQLYRKTLEKQIKIENGFEIIQQIRNGKKIVMKRKINQNNINTNHFLKGKKKQKNDFSIILNYKKSNIQQNFNQQQDQLQNVTNQPDPFLMDLFGKDLTKNKQIQQKKLINSQFQLNINSRSRKLNKNQQQSKNIQKNDIKQNNKKNKEASKKQKILKNQYSFLNKNNEQSSQFLIEDSYSQQQNLQFNIRHQNQDQIQQQKQFDQSNPDKFGLFINYQNLSLRNLDNESLKNIQFQKLLQMLGIPFLKAPSQAQAQCAYLEKQKIVDGIITQDSDTFLFGANHLFRGVFNDNIKYFSSNIIKQKLQLNQQKMIIFALLLGSDYTQGIKGIGIVNAMEILKIFYSFQKLQKFKRWAQYADLLHKQEQNKTQNILKDLTNQEQKFFYQFHKRFKNYWYIDDDFPKQSVINAYLKPQVLDRSRVEQMKYANFFELKPLNEEPVRIFLQQKLFLTERQINDYISILKKPFKKVFQTKMTDYFVGQNHQFAKIRSKRLAKALQKNSYKQKSN